MSDDKFCISLSRSEALVLFDLLTRYSETGRIEIRDQAEQRVLWDVCCLLESGLNEPLHPDYEARLQQAREKVRDET